MFFIHLKTAYRYLKNNLQFTVINVLGLTLGFYCFLLLNAYVVKETSFDANQKDVYRVTQKLTDENGKTRELASLAPRVGSESQLLFEEVELQTQFLFMGRVTVGKDPSNSRHEPWGIVDDQFLQVFNVELIEGSKEVLANQPKGLILTREIKERYFGKVNALHKLLKTSVGELEIVGVIEDFPENSHLENVIFITSRQAASIWSWYDNFVDTNWSENEMVTYLKIAPNANLSSLESKISELFKEHNLKPENNSTFSLQAVQDIHLYPNDVEGEINKNKGNQLYVTLFFWVAIFILLVASFNYAGLQNIAFIDRTKEISLRQIVGAGKLQLLWQFLVESLLLTTFSMSIGYLMLWLTEPLIEVWFGANLNLTQVPLQSLALILASGLILSILSVSYPFWLVVKNKKSSSLSRTAASNSNFSFRKVMLVFQSVAVIAFLTASLVFSQQMDFLKNKELGFEMDGLATVDINSGILRSKFKAIKQEFAKLPEVNAVSVSSRVPGEWKNIPTIKVTKQGQSEELASDMLFISTDKDFLTTFNAKLKEGANFSGVASDSTKVLLNATAIAQLGLKNPIGQYITVPYVNYGGNNRKLETPYRVQIVGVVEDFQIEDYRTAIKPLVIGNWNNPIHSIDYYTLKIASSDWSKTLIALKQVNDTFDPSTPIEFNILDDKFARFLETDALRFRLLNFFSGIVVLLSCMGLFAMSAFVARSRVKEIGIRKVVGASIPELLALLSKDFVKLSLIGLLFAAPLSWYLMKEWLSGFAYGIDFQLWTIALAGIICLILTLLTISYQSIRAAISNPVKSLRTE